METSKKQLAFLFLFLLSFPLHADLLGRSDEQIQKDLKKFATSPPYEQFQRKVRRVGDRTVEFEAMLTLEADRDYFKEISRDFGTFQDWVLRNINVRPSGGNYYSKIRELKPFPNDPSLLHLMVAMELPLWKAIIERDFKFQTSEKGNVFELRGDTVPHETSVIEKATGILTMVPHPTHPSSFVAIQLRATVKIRNWLLYEALPERILQRESGERIQIVLDNYHSEEERRRNRKPSAAK
jgi:hypothetical protein